MEWRTFRLSLATLALGIASQTQAAGLYKIPANGASLLARGGAFCAKADDESALYANPAGLAGHKGWFVGLDLSHNISTQRFQRVPGVKKVNGDVTVPSEERSYEEATTTDWTPIPLIAVTSDALGEGTAIGFALVAPTATHEREYPEHPTAAQRYRTLRSELGEFEYQLILAGTLPFWEDRIRIGALLGGALVQIDQTIVASADLFASEDPANDIHGHFFARDIFSPAFSLGVHVRATDFLELGLGYRSKIKSELKGEVRLRAEKILDTYAIDQAIDFTTTLRVPDVFRGGVRYVGDRWDIEVNVVYTRWSDLKAILFELDNPVIQTQPELSEVLLGALDGLEGDVGVHTRYRDSVSWSLGGSVLIGEEWEAHGGLFYDKGVIPEANQDTFFVDPDKWGFGLGATWSLHPNIDFTLSYAHVVFPETKVENSEVYSVNASSAGRTVVGEGSYNATTDFVNTGLAFKF